MTQKEVTSVLSGLLWGVLCIAVLALVLSVHACKAIEREESPYIEEVTNPDSLTEWQVFVMALVEVECERNPNLTSSENAIGPLQITKIYVEEVNRLYDTKFTFEDAWDLDKSLTMFEMLNEYYNPSKDIDRAIQLHNPGAGKWYSKRIKDRMKSVEFSEQVRDKIVEIYN